MVLRGADSREDQESAMPMFRFCDARLRILLAELTREWPRLCMCAGDPSVPVGMPAGKFEDVDDDCAGMSFHRLDMDCKELRAAECCGVRMAGGVETMPGPDPMGFCFG